MTKWKVSTWPREARLLQEIIGCPRASILPLQSGEATANVIEADNWVTVTLLRESLPSPYFAN